MKADDGFGGHDTLESIENVTASAYNDTVRGNAQANILLGLAGNDTISGLAGADTIEGGDGNDILTGGSGGDIIKGGLGYDIAVFSGAYATYTITTNSTNFTVQANSGSDGTDTVDLDVERLQFSNGIYESGAFTANTLPDAKNDNFVGIRNTNITGNLLSNNGNGADTDPDSGDSLTITSGTFATAKGGIVTLSSNGNFTYTPGTNFAGSDTFSYTLNDTRGGTDSASVNLVINAFANPTTPTSNQVFLLSPVSVNTVADSTAINIDTMAAKTISVAFTTGSDITTRQVIYEQGGGLRGLNIFIDNGKIYEAIWNYNAGVSWGYKEIQANISANTAYTATVVFSATSNSVGTFTGHLNGIQIDQKTGTGYLYAHSEDVGIGWMKDQSRFHGDNEYNDGHTFTGTIAKVAHYNAAFTGTTLQQLHDYMGFEQNVAPNAVDDDFVGEINTVITGNILSNNGNGVDSDPTNDPLTVSAGTITSDHGATVVLAANGSFTYTPVANFSGEDSFTYTIFDSKNGYDTGTATLSLNPTQAPTANRVFLINPVNVNTVSDSTAINLNTYYSAKTISVAFETGANITTRQVIYEQGGGVRGLAIFVEDGKLYEAVWNYNAGVSWGYKETSIQITANTEYTATFILNATSDSVGTLTTYLNGVQTDQLTGVGNLYSHNEDVGIGWMKDQSRFHGTNEYGDGHVFSGTVEKVIQYNAALSGSTLQQLHNYISYEWLDPDKAVFGTSTNNNVIGDENDQTLWGLQGDDVLYGKDGLDVLVGGVGADTFVFEEDSAFNDIDVIRDFSTSNGDKIDIHDLLSEYDPLTEALTDFIQITTSGSNSVVKVDLDGMGTTYTLAQIALIEGITGLTDEQSLVTSGNLVV